jgi:D-alanyl-D-alanine carboxypeptidase/D-alanyl-D-alanine-endopeptidase (penicillin-binding protein 4)
LERFQDSVDSMLNEPQFRNAHWGVLVVDPVHGDTLYSHNADKLFMPASNQKIITSAVGLTTLGADYRWRTPVELRGVQHGTTFTGDIVVRGQGDPSWSDAMHAGLAFDAFAPVSAALRARGISRIVGGVVPEGDVFSDEPYGFGWAFDDFDFGYSAPVDELLFNEGFFTVTIRAGTRVATLLTATTLPTTTYPTIIVRAVARERGDTVGIRRPLAAAWDSTASAVVVSGTLPLGDSARFELAYRHPNDAAVAALREALVASGIAVVARAKISAIHLRGPARTARREGLGRAAPLRAPDTLVVLESPPLREVLKRLDKPSQNQMAELLFKTASLKQTGFARADSARAVVERQMQAWGVPAELIAVRDGSGLSRHDYVAPRALVRVLDAMRQSPAFSAFYEAMPIAGVDGTIANRMKGTPAANNVHAKTGTVDKARSLSGYVTTADGQLLLFSFLCNNFSVSTRAVERVQDAIAVQLASMQLRSARTPQ